MLNKKESKFPSLIKDIIIIVIGLAIIWIGIKLVFGLNNPFYVVSSGSMVPVLNVGDILVVKGGDPIENAKIGDIIVFNRPIIHDKVIVHRVNQIHDFQENGKVKINRTNSQETIIPGSDYDITNNIIGKIVLVTKGDANFGTIRGTDYPITENDFIGEVTYVIPKVGLAIKYLTLPLPIPTPIPIQINHVIIVIIIGLLITINIKKSKKSQDLSA